VLSDDNKTKNETYEYQIDDVLKFERIETLIGPLIGPHRAKQRGLIYRGKRYVGLGVSEPFEIIHWTHGKLN